MSTADIWEEAHGSHRYIIHAGTCDQQDYTAVHLDHLAKVVFNKFLQLEVISFNYFSIMHSLENGHMRSPNFKWWGLVIYKILA